MKTYSASESIWHSHCSAQSQPQAQRLTTYHSDRECKLRSIVLLDFKMCLYSRPEWCRTRRQSPFSPLDVLRPGNNCRDARVYAHTITAMQDMSTPPLPPAHACLVKFYNAPEGRWHVHCSARSHPQRAPNHVPGYFVTRHGGWAHQGVKGAKTYTEKTE